ncbi:MULTISPECIES: hypothetical protein [Desulfosediminicola]|uniref:hypothetical protein n=1 Tax=Desulfosediminicola TaxID=2886823 RepID=UPI0010AC1013|nr:hypothetical protein [Desulfosediminicola ganghwensis]
MISVFRRITTIPISTITLLLLTVLLSASCTSKRLISSWSAEGDYQAREVLVVGVAHHESIRKLMEETVVEDLFKEDVTAIASYSIDGVRGKVDYDAVYDAVRLTDSKTVLVLRTVEVAEESGSQIAVGNSYDFMDNGSFQPLFAPRATYANYSRVQYTIEASLYDVNTKKKVWSAESRLTDPVLSKKYVSEADKLFIKDMKRNGIL